jgi:RNA polymerase sigma-70 factor (ECF subfamily)
MMVEMVKLKEMSLDEAAGASRMSVSAVKSLLHRALARLREDGNA